MATIPPTPARPRTTGGHRRPCTADCTGKRCAGIHPSRSPRRGMAALMQTTEARVQTR